MRKCNDIDKKTAPTSQVFHHGGITTSDWFSDKLHTQSIEQQLQLPPTVKLNITNYSMLQNKEPVTHV